MYKLLNLYDGKTTCPCGALLDKSRPVIQYRWHGADRKMHTDYFCLLCASKLIRNEHNMIGELLRKIDARMGVIPNGSASVSDGQEG